MITSPLVFRSSRCVLLFIASISVGCQGELESVADFDLPPALPIQCADEDLMLTPPAAGGPSDQHHNGHEGDTAKHSEHASLFAFTSYQRRTHLAVRSGPWFAPSTWATGQVPGDGSRVVIPDGLLVDYGESSDSRLDWVRVDGALVFRTDVHSKMLVETVVVGVHGVLSIGRPCDPMGRNGSAEIVIANNGDIDVSQDTHLLSRGIISHGRTFMHGERKTVHLKVAVDPMAGDTSLELAQAPSNWREGDRLVVAGSRYDSHSVDPEYDVVTVTSLEGNVVRFSPALAYNHDTPREDLKVSVANYSRNVTIRSEDGPTTPPHQRGHVMFMHSDNVDVRYVAAVDLGRTDKSEEARDLENFDAVTPTINLKGRYALHIHRSGMGDRRTPAQFIGNAVWGSPGWGYVHHDSNALFHNNASFNTFGAGFVAESGNETGSWTQNIAIYSKGFQWISPKAAGDGAFFDTARSGDGFFFQGRLVRSVGNIAANVNTGFTYMHRGTMGDGLAMNITDEQVTLPEITADRSYDFFFDLFPIRTFVDNETFASRSGGHVARSGNRQDHDVHSVLKDFTAWNVHEGFVMEYTQHYHLENFDLVGREENLSHHHNMGIGFGNSSDDMTVINSKITNFRWGFRLGSKSLQRINLVANEVTNVITEVEGMNETSVVFDSMADVPGLPFELDFPDVPEVLQDTSFDSLGTKYDSLGSFPLDARNGSLRLTVHSYLWFLQEKGYFTTPSGENHFVLSTFYTDRLTGELKRHATVLRMGRAPAEDFRFLGEMTLGVSAPQPQPDNVAIRQNQERDFDVLENDAHPDGKTLVVDGIEQPDHGQVFQNSDGTLTYVPDIDYEGPDAFRYWASDQVGNFAPTTVTLDVVR